MWFPTLKLLLQNESALTFTRFRIIYSDIYIECVHRSEHGQQHSTITEGSSYILLRRMAKKGGTIAADFHISNKYDFIGKKHVHRRLYFKSFFLSKYSFQILHTVKDILMHTKKRMINMENKYLYIFEWETSTYTSLIG